MEDMAAIICHKAQGDVPPVEALASDEEGKRYCELLSDFFESVLVTKPFVATPRPDASEIEETPFNVERKNQKTYFIHSILYDITVCESFRELDDAKD